MTLMLNINFVFIKEREKKRGKDVMWLKTVLSSGTLNDKIAAITLLIQVSRYIVYCTVDILYIVQ